VLDDRDRRAGAGRDRVGDVPDVVAEGVDAVLAGLRAGERPGLGALLARGADPDQRAGDRAELRGLVGGEIARLHGRDLSGLVLGHEDHVDQADRALLAQIGEHRRHLPGRRAVEADDQDLHRSELGHLSHPPGSSASGRRTRPA